MGLFSHSSKGHALRQALHAACAAFLAEAMACQVTGAFTRREHQAEGQAKYLELRAAMEAALADVKAHDEAE